LRLETPEEKYKTIDRAVVDALLVGIYRGLRFMGKERELVLEDMGDRMLDYLVEVGEVKPHGGPDAFRRTLEESLNRNGFPGRIPLPIKGSPPIPSMSKFIGFLARRISRRGDSGSASLRSSPGAKDTVDWLMNEMILYGMTRGLDSVGAQGQILMNRIGGEMLDYLLDSGRIKPTKDTDAFVHRVVDYFIKAGYADKVDVKYEGSPPTAGIFTYYNSRYHKNILPRLREAGNLLYTCPPCFAAGCIMKRREGVLVVYDVDIRNLSHGRVVLRHQFYRNADRFTEQVAEKTARMMK
jgi:hypothetical protein